MDDVKTPVVSGVVVFLAGLLAFVVLVGSEPEIADPTVAGAPTGETSLSALDPAVERVLLGTGDAWIYEADAGPGLPPELARVLDAYQAPLMIPTGQGQ